VIGSLVVVVVVVGVVVLGVVVVGVVVGGVSGLVGEGFNGACVG